MNEADFQLSGQDPSVGTGSGAQWLLWALTFLWINVHLRWTVYPFSVSMNYFQLIYAFILGIIYGNAYQVIYPMIMHSITNVIMIGLGFLFECIGN